MSRQLTATKTSHEKWIRIFSVFIVIIPTRSLCQMQANSSGAEFLSTISKFIEKKKILSCCLFTSFPERKNRHFHVVVVQWRQRNVQKSVMHVQSCCFALSSYCFFNTFSSPLHRYTLFHYLRYIVMRQKQNVLSANWIAPADRIRNFFRLIGSSFVSG